MFFERDSQMVEHVIAYRGKLKVSLGLMQEDYIRTFMHWANWRVGIEGTLQRPPYSFAQGQEWVRNLDKQKNTHEAFAILLHTTKRKKESHEYVGHTGIHAVKWPDSIGTTGSLIGVEGARGKGVGTEAKLLLLYHAFMVMGVRKISSNVKIFNAPSMGHLMKCGYKPIGRAKKHLWHEGAYVDEILFEIFREDWEPIWNEYQKTSTLPHLTEEQREFLMTETA